MEQILELARGFHVDGVLVILQLFCDPHQVVIARERELPRSR